MTSDARIMLTAAMLAVAAAGCLAWPAEPVIAAEKDSAAEVQVKVIRATGFSAPDFATQGPFDLVLANILANPLRQLAGAMAQHLAPSALVILSGLLTHQAPGVIAAYRARGLVPLRHLRIEGWSSLLLRYTK